MRLQTKNSGIALLALCPLLAFAQQPDPAEERYANLLRDIQDLRVYNSYMERQISAQEADLVARQTSMERIPDLERDLPPLLIEMVDGLADFVRLDVPFLTDERVKRIADLEDLVADPDVSNTEKLRRTLEAWSIEVEYGGAFRTYRGNLDGREVDFVQLGRIGLLYVSTDEAQTDMGAWNYQTGEWVELGNEHRNSVRQVLRMARNQVAPDLILLPTVPPER